jgi:hypothetical protein
LRHLKSLTTLKYLGLYGTKTTEAAIDDLAEVLFQFAQEGVELARQMLVGRELDFEGKGLRDFLLETWTPAITLRRSASSPNPGAP